MLTSYVEPDDHNDADDHDDHDDDHDDDDDDAQPTGSAQPTGQIGHAAAKAAALTHAGVSESQAYDMDVELDDEDGRWVYEVEFKTDGMEYEYVIDAYTGTVLNTIWSRTIDPYSKRGRHKSACLFVVIPIPAAPGVSSGSDASSSSDRVGINACASFPLPRCLI